MTLTCPRCGTTNDDSVKFCATCGDPLEPSVRPETPPAEGSPASPTGRTSPFRIIAAAAVGTIIILALILVLQAAGIVTVLPAPSPAVTTPITPVTIPPVKTAPLTETTPIVVPVVVSVTTEYPLASPATTETLTCPSDQRVCGANCTDIRTDPGNCGGCGESCTTGQICRDRQCITNCRQGEVACFGSCHNLSYDAQNCGFCGNSCPVGLSCNRSICSPTPPTTIPTYVG